MHTTHVSPRLARPVLALALLLSACGGGGGASGTLGVSLTDAPSCGYDHVYVTVDSVGVNASATAANTDAGWNDITLSPPQQFDLLALSNGVLANLGQTPLAAGHYQQIRLVLASNTGANPLANAVVPSGGSAQPLTTPSAQQSGIKLNADITVAADQLVDMVLDFNACKSIVSAGQSGQYLLKPVIAVTPQYLSGVSGWVDSSLANGNTRVSLQQGGVVVKAATPDSSGHFLLQPVAPGTYDLVVGAPAHASDVITAVPVVAATVTAVNSSSTALALPAATDVSASGTITISGLGTGQPILASVAATQQLTNGDTLEMASANADASAGSYDLELPNAAPQVAAYVVAPASLVFAADTTAATGFTLTPTESNTSATPTPATRSITVGSSPISGLDFGF